MLRLSFRIGFVALSLGAIGFLSCHDDKSAPTQPVVVMTPTAPPLSRTPTPPPAAAHNVAVGQGGNNFVDSQSGNSTTTVRVGTTVMWAFVGGSHSTTSGACCTGDGLWDSGVKTSGSFSHTFNATGNFPYFCTTHGAAMTGMVSVTP